MSANPLYKGLCCRKFIIFEYIKLNTLVVKTKIREGISYIIEERKETYYQSDNNQFNNHGYNIAVETTIYKNEQSLILLLF